MTEGPPSGTKGPGAPPPPLAVRGTTEETYRAMDRAMGAGEFCRVLAVMNAIFFLLGAIYGGWVTVAASAPTGRNTYLFGAVYMAVTMLPCLVNVACFYGADQLVHLKSRAWAFTALLLLMLPCVSPCFVVTLPVALYGIIALRRVPYDEWG